MNAASGRSSQMPFLTEGPRIRLPLIAAISCPCSRCTSAASAWPRRSSQIIASPKRERFLSATELRRVGEVLREMEQEGIEFPSAIDAARLLILTGCRLGEIMTLRWEHVDVASKALRLPASKTGAKVVYLGQQPSIFWSESSASRRIRGSSSAQSQAPDSPPYSHSGSGSVPGPASRMFASTTCGTLSRRSPWPPDRDCR